MQNTAVKSEALVESRSLRDQYVNNTEVLEKVKLLSMLPDEQHVTVEMAANYYEVPKHTVEIALNRHQDEFSSDGVKILMAEELKEFKTTYSHFVRSSNYSRLNRLTIIPRRAILRLGMLLRDSEVAKAVRDYLLNMEEAARKENDKAWEVVNTMVKMVITQNEMFINHLGQIGTQMEQFGKLVDATTDLINRIGNPPVNPSKKREQKSELPFYKRTSLARKLDLFIPGTKEPNAMAATCILDKIFIRDEEKGEDTGVNKGVVYTNPTYCVTVIPRMRDWLKENNYPTKMIHPKTGRTIRVQYGVSEKKATA